MIKNDFEKCLVITEWLHYYECAYYAHDIDAFIHKTLNHENEVTFSATNNCIYYSV